MKAFFSCGFRPFFLLASLYASASAILWLLTYFFKHNFSVWENPFLWHGHEMLFGFTMAVVAGFLLTAVPNWTKTSHLKSYKLGALVGIWALGRLGMLLEFFPASLDLLFIPALAMALAVPLLKSRNKRNFFFLILLTILFACNLTTHLWPENGINALYIAIFIVAQIIAVIGGRVIPMFTKNALKLAGTPTEITTPKIVNILALIAIPAVLISSQITHFESELVGILAVAGAAAHFVRLSFWQGYKTITDPIVWILHAAYLWIPTALTLLALNNLLGIGSFPIVLHALTMGAIGTMTLGMMSRVALGHTGRRFKISKLVTLAYWLVLAGTITRIIGGFAGGYEHSILTAGILWSSGFLLFAIVYLPILFRPRVA